MEPIRLEPEAAHTVTLPSARAGVNSGAQIRVHCVLVPATVVCDGAVVDRLEPEDSATYEARPRRFLWWELPPVWRRV